MELSVLTQDQIKFIINQAKNRDSEIAKSFALLDIYDGNIHDYIAASMAQELSSESFRVASKRIPSINLLRRIVKKLSKVYTDVPKRTTAEPSDQEYVTELEKSSEIQSVMTTAENVLNLNRCFALEPYIDSGSIKVRILAPHEFTVVSNDEKNPLKMTTFVKFMGSKVKETGKKNEFYSTNVYWIYTDSEFLIVDGDGEIESREPNPYLVIPFVYASTSIATIMPKADSDSFNNTILVPKLLADLNYATQFQSHSIMYTIDAEVNKASGSPDAVWNLQSIGDGENRKNPQVGVLSPTVDTDKVLSLIGFTVSQWLESRGIKPGAVGQLTGNNASSGISKIIDEADTTQVVNENRILLTRAEQSLWALIGIIQNTLAASGILEDSRGVSEPLIVSVSFPEQKPIPDPKERREELAFKLANKLISKRRALKEANPNLSDDEIDKLQLEIEAETRLSVETNQGESNGSEGRKNEDPRQ